MFEHSETVILDGKEYPIRCDINVLVEIQEQYGNLNEFEMRIAGLRITKNHDGSVITDKDNKVVFERTEPSIKAIRDSLPYMLKEAAEGKVTEIVEALEAVKYAKFDLYDTALKIHTEYAKCFERKNAQSARSEIDEKLEITE